MMLLVIITWITLLVASIISSSILEDLVENSQNNRNEIIKIPTISTDPLTSPFGSALRTLNRIKAFSPRGREAKSSVLLPKISSESSIQVSESTDEWENDSTMSMSVVSESLLEDLGLRSSRPSTPSLHSPSENLKKIISTSSSLAFLRPKQNSYESEGSSESSSDEFESTEIETREFDDKIITNDFYDQFALIEIDGDEDEEQDYAVISASNEMEITTSDLIPTAQSSAISVIPDHVLTNIVEYCGDIDLLEIRLTNKKFNEVCGIYLKLLSILTLKPGEADEATFDKKFHLSSTMMPFYRKQPQVRNLISGHFERPWNFMSLIEIFDLKGFKELAIFTDEFIETFLLPKLQNLPQNNQMEPSPIFLLGEALLKSKRILMFEKTILPILNRISVEIFSGIPVTNLFSDDFLNFSQTEEEEPKVLGATLHVAISYNLNFTVKHLIKLKITILNSKNHFGKTALLKIIEYLGKNRGTIQFGEEEKVDEWIEKANLEFSKGNLIQETFPGNSRLAIEMFLGILNQMFQMFQNREELISFLGFNQIYTIIVKMTGDPFPQRTTTLLHELVQAQQYDLIYYLGIYFGDLILCQLDINPLHMAAEMNDPALIAILLKFYVKFDVNSLTSSGSTALGLAVGAKCIKSLKVLLNDPRTDPNLNNSVSPLIRSIEIGPIEVVKLLLDHPSININHEIIRNSKILSPLGRTVALRKWDILLLLLRHPNNNYNIDQDASVLQHLKESEKLLMKFGDQYYDLLMLVRRVFLPTIEE